MKIANPYHAGELAIQERVGVLNEGARNARVIQDSIIKGALHFINQQSMVVLGSLDEDQNVWVSVIFGKTGFMRAEDEHTVTFELTSMVQNAQDPFWDNIQRRSEVGMLVIEPASRRRLRINGRIEHESDESLRLHVKESYPNCPKYIQRRQITTSSARFDTPAFSSTEGRVLGQTQRAIITTADTFFVASVHPERGVDASHRGGNAGFVEIVNDHTLRIPDYPGNSMFNTFGNFVVNPRAGLIFLDFSASRTLQLIGRPEIQFDVDGWAEETGGTNRFWELHIDRWLETDHIPELKWSFLDYSPHNPPLRNSGGA